MTYFDTAYVLKCYVEEPGWEQVPSTCSLPTSMG